LTLVAGISEKVTLTRQNLENRGKYRGKYRGNRDKMRCITAVSGSVKAVMPPEWKSMSVRVVAQRQISSK